MHECTGKSARGECGAPPKFEVSRPAGRDKVKRSYACGRHVGWLLAYMTVPGSVVTVRRLA